MFVSLKSLFFSFNLMEIVLVSTSFLVPKQSLNLGSTDVRQKYMKTSYISSKCKNSCRLATDICIQILDQCYCYARLYYRNITCTEQRSSLVRFFRGMIMSFEKTCSISCREMRFYKQRKQKFLFLCVIRKNINCFML